MVVVVARMHRPTEGIAAISIRIVCCRHLPERTSPSPRLRRRPAPEGVGDTTGCAGRSPASPAPLHRGRAGVALRLSW